MQCTVGAASGAVCQESINFVIQSNTVYTFCYTKLYTCGTAFLVYKMCTDLNLKLAYFLVTATYSGRIIAIEFQALGPDGKT